VALQQGDNFENFKSEGLHEKHAVATWNLGTISAFARGQGKAKKTCVEMGLKPNLRIQSVPQTELHISPLQR
jgi:hypothetical protein